MYMLVQEPMPQRILISDCQISHVHIWEKLTIKQNHLNAYMKTGFLFYRKK